MRTFNGVPGASGDLADADTRWTPEVANSIVQELVTLITDATGGDADIAPGDNTQVLTAILALVAREIAAALAGGSGGSGYVPLPGDHILQFGSASVSGNNTSNVLLPTTFPSFAIAAVCNGAPGSLGDDDNNPTVNAIFANSINVANDRTSTVTIFFFAIGK